MPKIGIIVILTTIFLSSCTSLWQELNGNKSRNGVSSSLVNYLYPNGKEPPTQNSDIPILEIPLRVGIAFVPNSYNKENYLTEAHKNGSSGESVGVYSLKRGFAPCR